jgi:type I restriction enzyme, S subunit
VNTATLDELVENCPANYGGDPGSRELDALVAKVSNVAGSGEFHREFETRSFTHRELGKLTARPGDLFVVKSSGSKKNILSGKTAIVAEDTPTPLIASNFLLLLRPNPELVDARYLWRVLNSSRSKAFVRTVVGTFTYPNLKWSTYRKHPVPLPPLAEQKRIAGVLDAADALRAKRRESIAQLDTLLQSTFLDMFGDPVTNPMGWEVLTGGHIFEDLTYGTSKKSSDTQDPGAVPVLRIPNIIGGEINWSDLKYSVPSPKEMEKLVLRCDDILFVRTNGNPDYIGRCARFEVSPLGGCIFASYLIRGRLPASVGMDAAYVKHHIEFPTYRHEVRREARTTAGNFNLSTAGIRKFKFIRPPLDLQRRFASLVESVERRKALPKAHLAELDTLFASLQSRAFKGEL